jgi:very-short-patch-repair endonuclease
LLHPFRTGGYHFRKQEQIGPFYVDFACHHARLVIEVDGDTHFTDAGLEDDARRDEFLRHEGYTVLRFTNDEVMHNDEGVYTVIAGVLAERPKGRRTRGLLDQNGPRRPLPGPPHEGEGEGAASPPVPVASTEIYP